MSLDNDEVISAQVMMRPASGAVINGSIKITSENIADYSPDPDSVSRAKTLFTSLGFTVGPPVGISFSVTAPVNIFKSVFRVEFHKTEKGGVQCIKKDGTTGADLPVEALPQQLDRLIRTVVFMEPPDFGPTNFAI